MKHSNIAIFVPHNGCPHACTFCNQREITGQSYQPTPQDVENAIQISRRFSDTKNTEIAFFGGSFTAIPKDYMLSLLEAASPYVLSGEFYGIRLSTRPDCISEEILDILKSHGVTAIELGTQSMCDEVLAANKRGHTVQDSIDASMLIKKYGFSLGLQMMTGLYKSSDERDMYTARRIAELQPDTVRIYPTIVMRGTELYDLYRNGSYIPQTLETAVPLCAELLRFFEEKDINVIRLGLHDSDSLKENMVAGAYHPAFRELCESEMMFENTMKILSDMNITNGDIIFSVNPRSVSRFVGQKKNNLQRLQKMGITPIIHQDISLSKLEVAVNRK